MTTSRFLRLFLLASTSFAGALAAADAATLPAGVPPVVAIGRDKGSYEAPRETVTIWLQHRNDLAAAVGARYDRNSPLYHRWMDAETLAAYGPSNAAVQTVVTALKAAGLTVTAVASDGSYVRAAGATATLVQAFHTPIHQFDVDGDTMFANTATPSLDGVPSASIVAISGLSNSVFRPAYARARDPAKKLLSPVVKLTASVSGGLSEFTTKCFATTKAEQSITDTNTSNKTSTTIYYNSTYATNCGYTASALQSHYGYGKIAANGLTGAGETLVIVDAYGSPSLLSDADAYATAMKLPKLDSSNFKIVYPDGPPLSSRITPAIYDWQVETSLDVEAAHALAPDAKIVVLVAPNEDTQELDVALQYAVTHHLGNVVSNSYGEWEQVAGQSELAAASEIGLKAAAIGMSLDFATGDQGDWGNGSPAGSASTPADSPNVTAVGGLSINVPTDNGTSDLGWGTYVSELGSQYGSIYYPPFAEGFQYGTGGGESEVFEKPAYQAALVGTGRMTPDVSAVADPETGAIIVAPAAALAGDPQVSGSAFAVVGGTSLATPVFSALWALANEAARKPLGNAAPALAAMDSAALTPIPAIGYAGDLAESHTVSGLTSFLPAPAVFGLSTTDGVIANNPVSAFSNDEGLYLAFSFGYEPTLSDVVGWNDITTWNNMAGWGEPTGLDFIQEAVKLK